MKIIFSKEIEAIFIFLSTIIGLGVFILPYTLKVSGFYFFLWLFFWFFVFYLIHLIFTEILLQTPEKHNLPGLAEIYLHHRAKHIVWIFDFFGMFGVFWIYLIALTKFWGTIFPDKVFLIKLIFVIFNIYFISRNIKIFAKFESILGSLIIIFFLGISFWLILNINPKNFTEILSFKNFFLPYGVLLFAFSGTSAVPLVLDILGKDTKKIKKINFISLFLISLIYIFYSLSVIGFLGPKTTEASVDALKPFIPLPLFVSILILITFNIMLVDLAFYLKRGLIYDYKLSPFLANIIINSLIFFLIFLPESSLVEVVSLISEIFLAFNLLIINLIYLKLKNKIYFKIPSLVVIAISLIFLLGIIHGIIR